MTGDQALSLVTIVVTALVARAVYRRAFRRATPCAPREIVDELRAHKIMCLGEPPERVALELSLLLGADERGAARHRKHQDVATHRGTAGARM